MCQMNLVTRGITVTDADINAFYELHKGDVYTMPERVHLKRIVLATQADAQDISNQISKGAAFESFLSRSTNKQYQDGDMPAWVSVENSPKQIQQFVDQVKNLSIGQTTPPIEYQGTWWLVKVVDKKPHEVIPLDSVKESVRIQVLSQKVGADQSHVQQMTQDLRNAQMAAKIVITLPQYQPLIALINNPPVQQMAPPAQRGGGGQPPAGGGGAPPPGGGGQPSGGGPPTQ
jgi:parvulin-like peptidyl-prolyl isomerase